MEDCNEEERGRGEPSVADQPEVWGCSHGPRWHVHRKKLAGLHARSHVVETDTHFPAINREIKNLMEENMVPFKVRRLS